MKEIFPPLEIEIYKLSVQPGIDRKTRALIMAAGAVQSGKATLADVIEQLNNSNFEGIDMPDEAASEASRTMAELLGTSEACCESCAYRSGTIQNQCAATVMDAIQCAATGEPFYCHNTGLVCEVWKATQKKP